GTHATGAQRAQVRSCEQRQHEIWPELCVDTVIDQLHEVRMSELAERGDLAQEASTRRIVEVARGGEDLDRDRTPAGSIASLRAIHLTAAAFADAIEQLVRTDVDPARGALHGERCIISVEHGSGYFATQRADLAIAPSACKPEPPRLFAPA